MERQVYSTTGKKNQSPKTSINTQIKPMEYNIDYKNKAIQLMKTLTELQTKENKHNDRIHYLEMEIQTINNQINNFLSTIGVSCFKDVADLLTDKFTDVIKKTTERDTPYMYDEQQEWSRLIEEYKTIIIKQQHNYTTLHTKYKFSKEKICKMRELQELESEKNKKCWSEQQSQLKTLKEQYRNALTQNADIKDKLAELQQKYHAEIYHFEEMEKHVEEKLLEVEKEMNYYQKERDTHLYQIEIYKKQIKAKQTQPYFSFGGKKHQNTQTDITQADIPLNNVQPQQLNESCYEASIKALLQENQRLKNALVIIYNCKKDQQLPQQVALQFKILLNMNEGEN